MELGEILTSINKTKKNLLTDEKSEKLYIPFVVNKCFSYHLDTLFQANFMNQYNHLDKKMQYDYLIESVTKGNRYCKWIKPEETDLEAIMSHYGYSRSKAMEVRYLLSKDQIKALKEATDTGGKH